MEPNFNLFTVYIKTNISLEEDSICSSKWYKEFDGTFGEFESLILQIPRLRAAGEISEPDENFAKKWN